MASVGNVRDTFFGNIDFLRRCGLILIKSMISMACVRVKSCRVKLNS